MQSEPNPTQDFASYYKRQYPHAVVGSRKAGRIDATALMARQPSGERKDGATPDLCIARAVSHPGGASIDLGAGKFRVDAPTNSHFILVAPGAPVAFSVECDHVIQALALPYRQLLEFVGPDGPLPLSGDFGHLHNGLQNDRELCLLLQKIWDRAGAPVAPEAALWLDGAILQIVSCLARLSRSAQRRPHKGGLTPIQLKRATDLMVADLAGEFSLTHIAQTVNLSPSHFVRAFSTSTGTTPYQWVMRFRAEQAKSAILSGRSLTEVAFDLGYSSQSAFGRAFKQVTGTSPAEYRKQAKLT